jgi:hypothetical protein
MRTIIAIFTIILLPFGSSATWQQQWKKATDFYLQKQYDSAAHHYELIAESHPQNAELYYNLGNTYYRLNKIGPAVLNYERALHADPGHKGAQDNLAITQVRISHQIAVTDDIFFVTWWHKLTSATMAGTWAVIAFICFLLALVIFWLRRYRSINLPMQLPGVFGFFFICAAMLGLNAAANVVSSHKAVVFENDTPLMDLQQTKGKPAALIPEGTTVRIISDAGQWLEVRLPDSRTGWVQASQVEKV